MHVNYLCEKLSSVTGVLSRCRSLLPTKAKVQIYNALFHAHLNYCALVWSTTTITNIRKILMLQKKIIRYIDNIDYYSSTREAFPKYNIIRIDNLYTFVYYILRDMLLNPSRTI
uniref:Putative endonuclease/reverse transcript n=1 Tax=Rhipicephalus microplus TaxID=6941 RepID=A0A6G5AFJ6_RHIMP